MTRNPYLVLFLLASLWSSAFTAIKFGVETVPPTSLVAGRLLIGALLLLAFAASRGRVLPQWGAEWGIYFVLGAAGYAIPFFLISWGEVLVDSGPAAILMAIMPLTTMMLAHFFARDEKMTVRKAVGLALGLAGVVVLVGPGALAKLGSDTVRELAIAGGAVFYAINAVISRRLPPGDPVQRSAAVVLCAAILMMPIAIWSDFPLTDLDISSWMSIGYLGVFPTAIATVIFFHLIDTQGASFVSLNNYIIPCLGVLWGVLLLGETVTLQSMVALLIILIGIAVATAHKSAGTPAQR
ncbi:MAG: EamA family transporter [Rhodospirillales bacterium]